MKKIFKIILLVVLALFVFSFLFLTNKVSVPTVISTSPINNAREVPENTQVEIVFNKDISEKAKTNISVVIDPQTDFDGTWTKNVYKISLKKVLANARTYQLTVNYKTGTIHVFSFTTQTFSQEDIQKKGLLQTQNDIIFGQAQKDFIKKYPFYTSMPIRNKNYIIDFNSENKKFAITFLTENLTQTQKDEFIVEALADIRKLGIKDPIQYYTR